MSGPRTRPRYSPNAAAAMAEHTATAERKDHLEEMEKLMESGRQLAADPGVWVMRAKGIGTPLTVTERCLVSLPDEYISRASVKGHLALEKWLGAYYSSSTDQARIWSHIDEWRRHPIAGAVLLMVVALFGPPDQASSHHFLVSLHTQERKLLTAPVDSFGPGAATQEALRAAAEQGVKLQIIPSKSRTLEFKFPPPPPVAEATASIAPSMRGLVAAAAAAEAVEHPASAVILSLSLFSLLSSHVLYVCVVGWPCHMAMLCQR